jgi:sugar (pentulose or hexulose) kinase
MIIGFDSQADLPRLDPRKDTFAFTDVFGRPIGCCRFFGGREFETLLAGAPPGAASLQDVQRIVEAGVFALPSFSDTGGPMPGTGRRGRIEGPFGASTGERASLATLYAALMMSELLDALGSASDIVVDGPFARNALFCGLLAAIRPTQAVSSSGLQEGTAAGAAVLALMSESGELPRLPLDSAFCESAAVAGLDAYVRSWRAKASAA